VSIAPCKEVAPEVNSFQTSRVEEPPELSHQTPIE
jgi:hypothetical protein